jgi:predicted TIM-barrel fold metal-dependent hydrolase
MPTMPIIDIDTHVTEPPDLWSSRLGAKWGDLAPHAEWDDARHEFRWRVGKSLLMGVSQSAHAGWTDYPPSYPPSLEAADRAAWDPKVRLERMDEYGILAQVLYPNVMAFSPQHFMNIGDPALANDCARAYNDFLAEFAATDPNRLIPIMILPFWDIDASIEEVHRAADLGHRGVLFAAHFEKVGLPNIWDPRWSRLLHVIEDRGLSLNLHIGFGTLNDDDLRAHRTSMGDEHARLGSALMIGNARAIADVVGSGLCHRHPRLNVVSVESGAGWLLFLMESLDWHWKAFGAKNAQPQMELPSFYVRRQVYGSFWFENESLRAVAEPLQDNIMLESDFPHGTSLSPGPASPAEVPRVMADNTLAGLPESVRAKLLYGNAARVYGIDV